MRLRHVGYLNHFIHHIIIIIVMNINIGGVYFVFVYDVQEIEYRLAFNQTKINFDWMESESVIIDLDFCWLHRHPTGFHLWVDLHFEIKASDTLLILKCGMRFQRKILIKMRKSKTSCRLPSMQSRTCTRRDRTWYLLIKFRKDVLDSTA